MNKPMKLLSYLASAHAKLGQFDEAWRCVGEYDRDGFRFSSLDTRQAAGAHIAATVLPVPKLGPTFASPNPLPSARSSSWTPRFVALACAASGMPAPSSSMTIEAPEGS
jgi:pentatricopeptide repeat protein